MGDNRHHLWGFVITGLFGTGLFLFALFPPEEAKTWWTLLPGLGLSIVLLSACLLNGWAVVVERLGEQNIASARAQSITPESEMQRQINEELTRLAQLPEAMQKFWAEKRFRLAVDAKPKDPRDKLCVICNDGLVPYRIAQEIIAWRERTNIMKVMPTNYWHNDKDEEAYARVFVRHLIANGYAAGQSDNRNRAVLWLRGMREQAGVDLLIEEEEPQQPQYKEMEA